MYQSIMMDLDGTVLTPANTVTDELNSYLKTLRSRGVHIFAVSGRTLREALDLLPADFPIEGMVSANGMAVYAGEKKIFQSTLPVGLVMTLIHRAEEKKLYYQFHPKSGGRAALNRDKAYLTDLISGDRPNSVSRNEWLSRRQAVHGDMIWKDSLSGRAQSEVIKLYFFDKNVETMEKWKTELTGLSRKMPFDCFSSSHSNVEVISKNISKASGIRILLDYLHLTPDKALAIGDGENDLPMFRITGHSAAMKNAPDHVQAKADEVTDHSYAENGLYQFLKKTFG